MDRKYLVGVVLVAVSAVIWSSAGIFTRGVAADAWAVIFWRGVAAAGFTLAYLMLRGVLAKEIRQFTGPSLLISVLGASGTAAFIPAFKLSSVANVAVIWAAAPFLAAALAWIFLRERPATRVVLASAATFGGVLILAWGSLRSGSVIGDLLALWMTLMMSSVFVVYRRWPETPAGFPTVMASLFLLPFAYAFTDVASMPANEIWILVAFGAVFSMASVLMFEGARRIPSAEVALIGTLETPLAFVLAFLILGEVPLNATLIGGAIIFVSVVWAQGRAFKE
ncbi:MAG: DMT family transporter [Amylibacter sp.]|jgi:drug/metabolite transporter (DMT)-like permease|nr:DMT family transporter [Amylibacter sp.]